MAKLISIVNNFGEAEYTPPDNVAHIRQGRKTTIVYLKAGGSIYARETPETIARIVQEALQ